MYTDFKSEEKELLEAYLDTAILRPEYSFDRVLMDFSEDEPFVIGEGDSGNVISGIELIVRPECNQKCEYCYVARYGKELYPVEERLNKEQILHNIDMIFDYVFNEKNLYINHWELFAGDMFYDDLFFDVCDVLYQHLIVKKQQYPSVFANNEGVVVTPTNFSFIHNPERKARLEEYIDKFRNDLNWELGFSVSTDGKYATDTREGHEMPDEFFDDCFQWTINHPRNGFHPMISASNVHNAIKNYDWWRDITAKWYTDNKEKKVEFLPYWLEARNDEWTQENIDDYLKLLNHMVNDRFKMCHNNIDELAYHFTCGDGYNNTLPGLRYNDLIWFPLADRDAMQRMGCAMAGLFIINVSNLSMVPCHRLTYPQFKGGYFKVENNHIVGVEPHNVSGYLMAKTAPAKYLPKCASCAINVVCHKGCFGAQYEATGELFNPCISVCNLEMQTKEFLFLKYKRMGLWQSIQDNHYKYANYLPNIVDCVLQQMPTEREMHYEQFITD